MTSTMTACANCQGPLHVGDRFCANCGALAPAQSTAPATPAAGASLQVPAGAGASGEERRLVTVVFADLSGSTELGSRLDPEVLRRVLSSFFGALARQIQRYGGTIDKYIGDAIMAVFGAPVGHEDDAERAVRAALDMQKAITELNETLERQHGVRLALRIGVNTGEVVAGMLASDVQSAYTIVGDTVNTAQRLESAAQPGAIVVGAVTRRLTARAFQYEQLEPLQLKGKAQPVTAYRVVGPSGAAAAPPPSAQVASPLVGRDKEFATLTSAIWRLRSGTGGIVSVIADAGLGKSRLISEVRARSANAGVHWLEGRALSITQTVSYWPFLEIMKRDIGISEDDDERKSWTKLERRMWDLFPDDVAETLPYMATLLGVPIRGELEERVKYLDGDAMGQQIFLVSRRYFARLAQDQPLVLLFEDWHWADESSATLLEHVLPLTNNVPLLVCVVARPDAGTPAARLRATATERFGDVYTEVVLSPLSPQDSARLVDNLLTIQILSQALRDTILRKTEGNPFFIEEVVRSLIDIGAVVRDEATGSYRALPHAELIVIPDTVQGVLMARIDRLDDELKQMLKLAAVIGRSFFYRVLQAVAEAGQRLDVDLGELERLEFLREKSRAPELEYIFKHVLVQEAAYHSILLERRRQLHRQVGERTEALFAGRLEEFYPLLAYHFARAEDWVKAQEYLFKAGDRAGRLAGDAEALTYYREALAAYERAFGDRWDPLQRASLEHKMAEALFRRGEHSQALEYLERALGYLGIEFPKTRTGIRLAIARELLRQIAHRKLGFLFLRPGRQLHPAAEQRARTIEVMGWIDYFADAERFVLEALQQLNYSESGGSALGTVYGHMALGLISDIVPLPDVAGRYFERAFALAQQMQHPLALGLAHVGLAVHAQHATGDNALAMEHYERSAERYEEAGDMRKRAAPRCWLADVLVYRGEYRRAVEIAEDALRVARDANDGTAESWASRVLGRAFVLTGDLKLARMHVRRAIELAGAIPDTSSLVTALADLAEIHLRDGRRDEALSVLEEARGIIEAKRIRTFFATRPRLSLAYAQLLCAEHATGSARREALRAAERACAAVLAQAKLDREADPAAYRYRGTYSWITGDQSGARKWWRRSTEAAEKLSAPYESAATSLEIGRREGNADELRRAEETFARIGAKPPAQ